ncbi:NEW3 domain-containing protein [Psychromicrobium xiongbiense]|uniref:NEW3 domain-containing protein n=1 Tax=Psychromicrobium xiongbiense TaxID=3051184 RepID=UPI002556B9E9|nr:NEW3 domain-containing protein [Psychromicrobium sp. YIM S02556]
MVQRSTRASFPAGRTWLAGLTVAGLLLSTLGLAPAQATDAQAAGPGTEYHLSCAPGAPSGDGSVASPFTTLAQANAVALQPGDQLLLARGTSCQGTLQPKGSGTASAAVTIGAYGTGALPIVDGNGAQDAVLLSNVEHLVVQDLELVNATHPGSVRNGLRLTLNDFGKGTGYLLQRLTIHDVRGGDTKGLAGSAGIQIAVTGSVTPTWFDDLTIRNNTIHDVDREGIYTKSTWNKRPEVGSQDTSGLGPWTPSTRVVISGNQLSSIAGDGIKVDSMKGAVIEHNTLTGFQLRSAVANAGIWPFNADDTVVQYNEVSGGGNSKDGMSFDADGGAQRTIFQYNYSHHNAGGLLLLCPYSGAFTYGTVMRYNISVDDGERLFQLCPGDIQQTSIYNNTVVNSQVTPRFFLQDDNSTQRQISWRNNVVVNRGATMTVTNHGPVLNFDHNLLIGVGPLPTNPDGSTNPGGLGTDPGLVDASAVPTDINNADGLKLRADSPALGAGALVATNGGRDFYGNPVSATAAPNMGAYQGPGIVDDAHPVSLQLNNATLLTGHATTVTAQFTWSGTGTPVGVTSQLSAPAGWQVSAMHAIVPSTLTTGQSVTLSWLVTPPSDAAPGPVQLTASALRGGAVIGSATVSSTLRVLYPTLASAFNDVAITADGATPYTGDLALSNSSLSANALKAAKGIAPGASVTGAQITYSWPGFVAGKLNAVWSTGQSIALSGAGQYLAFAVIGVNGSPSGTAIISYSDGTSSSFPLAAGDYFYNKPAAGNTVLTTMGYRNTPAGKDVRTVTLFESTVPIDPTKTVSMVTLPALAARVDGKTPGLLVLAMGLGGTPSAPPASTPDGPVILSAQTVHPGDTLTFSGSGFYDAEQVSGVVHSQPVALGSGVAQAGQVSMSWTVPANFELGEHTVQLTGADSGRLLSATFQVVAAPASPEAPPVASPEAPATAGSATTADAGQLAVTGRDPGVPLALASLALLGGIVLLGLLGWRPRRRPLTRLHDPRRDC